MSDTGATRPRTVRWRAFVLGASGVFAAGAVAASAGVTAHADGAPADPRVATVDRVAAAGDGLASHPLREDAGALHAVVAEMACRLDPGRCPAVGLHVLRQPGPQARMLPGTTLVLNTGLLLRLRDEDELAFVIAHELAHVRRGDVDATPSRTQGIPDAAAARARELAVDAEAIAMMRAAGYDPEAARRLWRRLLDEAPAAGDAPASDSHPPMADRLAALGTPAPPPAPADGGGPRAGSALAVRTWLADDTRVGAWLADEVRFGSPARTRVMLASALGDATTAGDREAVGRLAFALAEHHRLHDGAGARSAELHALAAGSPGALPEAFREHGFALIAAGEAAAGTRALRRFLDLAPDAPDAAYVRWRLDGTVPPAEDATSHGAVRRTLGLRLPSSLRWRRHKGIGAEVWTLDGTGTARLFVVGRVPPGEPLFRAIVPAAPRWRPGARPDETVELALRALHVLGHVDLAWSGLRPHDFGGVPGWRAEFAAASGDGRRQHGSLAFAVRDGDLAIVLWVAPDAQDPNHAAVAAMLDGMRFTR